MNSLPPDPLRPSPLSASYQQFLTALKNKAFKNIVVFTGPGIGVPDFKSHQNLTFLQKEFLREYNLARPEQVFDLEFYRRKPEAFTKLANEFLLPKNQQNQKEGEGDYSWTS
jgi:NAD-dependent SIR2 family protein deacetylase